MVLAKPELRYFNIDLEIPVKLESSAIAKLLGSCDPKNRNSTRYNYSNLFSQ